VVEILEQLELERLRPLRREEYEHLVDRGCFDDERVELLRGVLVAMSPQGALHAEVIRRLVRLLGLLLGDRGLLQAQSPLALGEDSEPEPDLAIVPPGDYVDAHPSHALLVVEVADSSLRRDRLLKVSLYAGAAIPEYWLVNLEERVIEVYRNPAAGQYGSVASVGRDGVLRPLALPGVELAVADLLPPRR
jgi:Uma2 family endonuclease